MLVWLVLVAVISGCSYHVAPTGFPVRPGTVPVVRGDQSVTVTNGQHATEDVVLGDTLGHFGRYYGNLRQFTGEAVSVLTAAVQNWHREIASDRVKEVTLAVTQVRVTVEGLAFVASAYCVLTLMVETDDRNVAGFVADNTSPIGTKRACSGAVTRAVEAMLNDPKVGAYLAK